MEATLDAVRRDEFGKNAARRHRRNGRVPAVVYGGADDGHGIPIAVEPKPLLQVLRSESGVNTLITLNMKGGPSGRVLIKEFQVEPLRSEILHVDFYRVAMDKVITVTVPIVLKGEARGVKQQGGLLDFVHREVEIECLPTAIPEHLDVDVTDLMVGQGVRFRDLTEGVAWKPVSEPDTMLVHVIAPKMEAEEEAPAEPAEAAAATEPEVIKRGKAEKGEEES